jgi:hypothetical protein
MGSSKTWIELVALAAGVAVAMALLFAVIGALQTTAWMAAGGLRTNLCILAVIVATALANCLVLVGIGVWRARMEGR